MSHPRQHGFTLVELMVTVAVIVVLVSIGASSMNNFRAKQEVSTAVENIVSKLQRAKSIARKTSRTVTISTDHGTNGSKGWGLTDISITFVNDDGDVIEEDSLALDEQHANANIKTDLGGSDVTLDSVRGTTTITNPATDACAAMDDPVCIYVENNGYQAVAVMSSVGFVRACNVNGMNAYPAGGDC